MTTLTIQPNATAGVDTWLSSYAPDTANDTDTTLRSRKDLVYNPLFKFDLSGIPGGATISSATLTLYLGFTSGAGTHVLHRILAANSSWTEGATWNYAVPSSTRWAGDTGNDGGSDAGCSVSGTDYAAATLGTITFTSTPVAAYTAVPCSLDLTEFGYLLAANYGIVMVCTTDSTYNYFCASDNDAGYRPKLDIEYTAGSAGARSFAVIAG